MCRIAELSVGIIEAEGAYGRLIANVDICTRSIEEALDVLAMPKRMVATLKGISLYPLFFDVFIAIMLK